MAASLKCYYAIEILDSRTKRVGIINCKKLSKRSGFTIIEVMIVLAIAGLILVIVFLAVPQLQRSTRDTERKQYAREVFTAMNDYFSVNGHYPNTPAERQKFINSYMPKDKDPLTGLPYTNAGQVIFYDPINAVHSAVPAPGQIFLATAHWCYISQPDGTSNPIVGNDTAVIRFVIWIGTEGSLYYCVDNY